MGLDYVDIFYSHRFDPETPVEETMMALDTAVRSGRALYAGISSYSAEKTAEAATIARDLGTPLLIHQPSYSMLNRWIEPDLLDELERQGMGCIVFTALAQGLLTDRYLDGVPEDSRAAREGSTIAGLDEEVLDRVRALNEIAERRGQKLAQLALQWALRDPRVTSAVIGASSVEQLDTNLDALDFPPLTDDELAEIDKHAVDSGVNLWAKSDRRRSQQNRSDARLFGVSALLHGEATMTAEFDEWVAARGPGAAAPRLRADRQPRRRRGRRAGRARPGAAAVGAHPHRRRPGRLRPPDGGQRAHLVVAAVPQARDAGGRGVRPAASSADPGTRSGTACGAPASRLPEAQRVAVVLRYYEQLEYAEIAALTGVAEGSVRSRVSRGLAALARRRSERSRDHD